MTSVSSQEDEGGLKSMRYNPLKASYGAHYDTEDVSDFHDNPTDTGGPFEDEDLDPVKDTDAEKGFVTIGHFEAGQPRGLAWQWRSERDLEGFLYGDLDDKRGRGFTGEGILYLYPDLVTGLRGRFSAGEAVEAPYCNPAPPPRPPAPGPAPGWLSVRYLKYAAVSQEGRL